MTDCQEPKLFERCERKKKKRCGLEKAHWHDKCPLMLERGGGHTEVAEIVTGLSLNHSGNFTQGPGPD